MKENINEYLQEKSLDLKFKEDDKFEQLKCAIALILMASKHNLIDIHKFNTKEEDPYVSVYSELIAMTKDCRRSYIKNRITYFIPEYLSKSTKKALRPVLKNMKSAYKYILKNKSLCKEYVNYLVPRLCFPEATWVSPDYHSGDGLSSLDDMPK